MSDAVVVLLLPDPGTATSLTVLGQRCMTSKGHDWAFDGHDFLQTWLTSEQNHRLADIVAYSGHRTADEYAEHITMLIGRRSR